MIVTFDFGIFPTSLSVSSEINFDKLKEYFAFDTEENGYIELSQKMFDNLDNSNGVTASVIQKETMKKVLIMKVMRIEKVTRSTNLLWLE